MGKNAQKNKKRKRQDGPAYLPTPPMSHPSSSNPASGGSPSDDSDELISPLELETTLLVLRTLLENPEELSEAYLKSLKRDLRSLATSIGSSSTLTPGANLSLTARISAALQESQFDDALILLFEMYTRRVPPKLGAIQRWVRECDATSGVNDEGDVEAMRCLDMILRVASMGTETEQGVCGSNGKAKGKAVQRTTPVWRAREETPGEIRVWERMCQDRLFDTTPPVPYPNFRPVHHVPGPQRRPPNLYDSTVYASSPSAICLSSSSSQPKRLDVPGVPEAFMVLDVFTPEECLQIVQAASAIGFERDEAAEGSARTKTSILARNFVWLADQPFLDHFYSRIAPFFPQTAPMADGNGGGRLKGINARFRVYQYTENQVYRPHIDGAWPAAGLHPETGEYMHDSSPPENPLWSRYTLLVYLNQDIPADTGCTTFFLPSEKMGVMDAVKVAPIQGAVLCFPHGDTQGSLLHEGSAVGSGGGKIVIRTDLLYEAKGFGVFKPPASVGIAQGGRGAEGLGG